VSSTQPPSDEEPTAPENPEPSLRGPTQDAPLQIKVSGTDEPVPLQVRNLTPQIVRLKGSDSEFRAYLPDVQTELEQLNLDSSAPIKVLIVEPCAPFTPGEWKGPDTRPPEFTPGEWKGPDTRSPEFTPGEWKGPDTRPPEKTEEEWKPSPSFGIEIQASPHDVSLPPTVNRPPGGPDEPDKVSPASRKMSPAR